MTYSMYTKTQMKTLTLIRHAKSSWKHPGLEDRERPLNKRGKQDRYLIGQRLCDMGVKPDRILSSPAKRAIKTANAIADMLDYPRNRIIIDECIYMQGAGALLRLIHELSDLWQHVLLIGHNPDITALANDLLTDAHIANIPTCGVVSIALPSEHWRETAKHQCRLTHFDTPKQLATVKSIPNSPALAK